MAGEQNKVEHRQDGTTVITLERRDGQTLPCYIDTADYPKVKDLRWFSVRGYAVSRSRRRIVFMHRLLTGFRFRRVDHRDGNGLNNRRSNLRRANARENAWNQRLQKSNRFGFKGIAHVKRSANGPFYWRAQIRVKGGNRYRHFASMEEAARGYDDLAREHFGEFACVNFPREGERGARTECAA